MTNRPHTGRGAYWWLGLTAWICVAVFSAASAALAVASLARLASSPGP